MHALLLPTRGLLAPAGRLAAVAAAAAARAHASARRQLQQHAVWNSWVPHASQPARAAPSSHPRTGSVRAAAFAAGAAAEAGQRPRRTSKRAAAQQQHQQRQQQHQQQRQQRQQQVPAPSPCAGAEDAFYAEAAATFEELGVAPALASALTAAGFARPSRVQELVIPEILSGRDVVLAAETGSGKTLAYVAPMASLLLAKAAAGQQAAPAMLSTAASSSSSSSSRPAAGSAAALQQRFLGLVLCPNSALCQQVVRLVGSLFAPSEGDSTSPLLRAAHISSANPPPFDPPDIVVATPGALVTLFNDRGFSYGSQWTAEGVAARAAFVVLDEADLLCQGGYVKDVMRLLDAFKAGERRLIEAQVCAETGLDREAFGRLPRLVKIAAWEGGTPAMRKAGWRPRKAATASSSTPQEDGDAADAAASPDAATPSSTSSSSNGEPEQQQLQSYGPYFHRQYLFVAATMPALTKGDVGVELQKRFKDAVWVSGDMLHQIKPNVTHSWVAIGRAAGAASAGVRAAVARAPADDDAVADECLLAAITEDPDYQAGAARVLVFTRNIASADRVAAMLEDAGVPNWLYHKNMPPADQAAALAAMAQQPGGDSGAGSSDGDASGNRVLVSTDAAARGIDLPGVTHVVQADFAANAIEFLHRVGRTARAGRGGKVTSLYGRADSVLADALQRYIKEGRPVEECFSRNRSFSRKVKRYGGFVPRGQEGPQAGSEGDEK